MLGLSVHVEQPVKVFLFTAMTTFPHFSQEILHFTQTAMEKVLENYYRMPDWAMGSIGTQTMNLAALGWSVALPQSLPSSAFDLEKYSQMHCFSS